MATIKSYTTIEQSRKLAEILPLESADMEYMFLKRDGSEVSNVPFVKDGFEEPECCYIFIPCWSLAALLGVLPNNKHITTTLSRGGWKIGPVKYIDKWFCEYEDKDEGNTTNYFFVTADNPVDACYEIIPKLHELKML